ncbi:MAG: hypothetical protein ACJATI_001509 [Halioglobus sp.]|jgi:hypothetical protein
MDPYKVTYLLGAGASYHSIPVVNTLNERMKLFLEMFFDESLPNPDGKRPINILHLNRTEYYKEHEDCIDFLKSFRPVFYEAIQHRTIDTYARKLYLRNEDKKLNDLKRFLALYFAFEQSEDKQKIITNSYSFKISGKDPLTHKDKVNHINTVLDYRYDVFFASLLDKELKLPENVNIISWNYDHQLEMGYQNYSDKSIHQCQERLGVFPREGAKNGKVIKLNGSAHQYYDINKETFLFDRAKDNIYKSILASFSDEILKNREFALNFAWEKGANQLRAIELAEGILSSTDELVIIGYSFPYFNRDVDIKLLMKTLNSVKRIKVMVHPNDFESVKQSIEDITGEDSRAVVPELHNDLDQFYIPSKFFGNPDIIESVLTVKDLGIL